MEPLLSGFLTSHVKESIYSDDSCNYPKIGVKGYGSSFCWLTSNNTSYNYGCNGNSANINTFKNGNCKGNYSTTILVKNTDCYSNSTFSCITFSTTTVKEENPTMTDLFKFSSASLTWSHGFQFCYYSEKIRSLRN